MHPRYAGCTRREQTRCDTRYVRPDVTEVIGRGANSGTDARGSEYESRVRWEPPPLLMLRPLGLSVWPSMRTVDDLLSRLVGTGLFQPFETRL